MSIVKREVQKSANIDILDKGIRVKQALELIRKYDYFDEIYESFHIKDIENEFIAINGSSELVAKLIRLDEEYFKFDIYTIPDDVNVIEFSKQGEAIFDISNIEDESTLEITDNLESILVESAYSVKTDYFNKFQIDKYLDFCLLNGYQDIIKTNLDMLKEKFKDVKKENSFRLLKGSDNNYLARAITSKVYKDYNLRFSLFIALIKLHELNKKGGMGYYIDSYNMSESDAKIVFKSKNHSVIAPGTNFSFSLELVNDEIKRDAVKFNGIYSFSFGDSSEIYVRPDEAKSRILTFPHSLNIGTVKQRLSELSERIDNFIKEKIDFSKIIRIAESPELFKEKILFKIRNSKNDEFNKYYRENIQKMLLEKVNTVYNLCNLLGRINLLIDAEHSASLEFWRFKLYLAMMDEGEE